MPHSLPELTSLVPDYAAILRRIAEAPPERSFVVAQLGQSLDGRIALPSGESRWINNSAALDHVHWLRAIVDAVVVGVGTAVADDPQLNVRRVAGPNPVRVVIDPNGRLPPSSRLLSDDGAERIVVTRPGIRVAGPARHLELACEAGSFDPGALVAALYDLGLRRLLIEGGAQTVSSFIAAGAVDRLHLLLAPCILGAGKTGINFAPPDVLAHARRPKSVVHVLGDGDVLFDCDMQS